MKVWIKWVVLVLGAGFMASGCCKGMTPKVGDKCEAKTAACLDPKTILTCEGGKFASMACKGAKGCYTEKDMISCDFSGNAKGDGCTGFFDDQAECTPDNKTQVLCKKGKIATRLCGGKDACKDMGAEDICDLTVTSEGAYCSTEGSAACSTDGKTMLACKGGAMVKDEVCHSKCVVKGVSISCE